MDKIVLIPEEYFYQNPTHEQHVSVEGDPTYSYSKELSKKLQLKKEKKEMAEKVFVGDISFFAPGDFVNCGVHWEKLTLVDLKNGIAWAHGHMIEAHKIIQYIKGGKHVRVGV